MPRPPSRSGVLAAALTALALAVTGCSDGGSPTPVGPDPTTGGTTTPAPTASAPDPSALATTLAGLLARRDRALVAGDLAAYTATVADPSSADGRQQLASFAAARALGPARVAHDTVAPVDDPTRIEVVLRYRLAGLGTADRTSTVSYRLARTAAGWRIGAERATGTDPAAPWVAMHGLRVRRGAHGVAAGTASATALAEAVRTVDRDRPGLRAVWAGTPDHVLVLAPATEAEADLLLGRSGAAVGRVGATTEGPQGADGRAPADRVVLDPDAAARLTPTGRDVVLTHELTHVAVRATLPGTSPTWLAEGYADHLGYARAGLPQARLAAPLVAAVRAGTAPRDLPTTDALDPAVADIEVAYLAAWQAVEVVADERGEDAVRRLVRACTGTAAPDVLEARCDAAMPRAVGWTRAELTRRWQERLRALAR